MTFIEQACHRQVIEMRSALQTLPVRIVTQTSRYFEISGMHPTSSASMVLLGCMSAAGAAIYRAHGPALAKWKRELVSEPELVRHRLSVFRAKTNDELRLHQEIFARLVVARMS